MNFPPFLANVYWLKQTAGVRWRYRFFFSCLGPADTDWPANVFIISLHLMVWWPLYHGDGTCSRVQQSECRQETQNVCAVLILIMMELNKGPDNVMMRRFIRRHRRMILVLLWFVNNVRKEIKIIVGQGKKVYTSFTVLLKKSIQKKNL